MKARVLLLFMLLLGLASCSDDHTATDVPTGELVTMTLNVSIPECTRGGEEGFDVATLGTDYELRYILEVYHNVSHAVIETKYTTETATSFDITLVPERDYRFVVWADIVKKEASRDENRNYDNHYNTANGLKNITMRGDWRCDDVTREAFTGYVDVYNFTSHSNISGLSLVRPFAKLRLQTSDTATAATKIMTTYDSVPMTYNAYDGSVGSAKEMVTHQPFDIASYDDAAGVKTLFTDYIFASQAGDDINLTFTTYDAVGGELMNKSISGVALKRNTLTTIKIK